jgi:hypothetical protein
MFVTLEAKSNFSAIKENILCYAKNFFLTLDCVDNQILDVQPHIVLEAISLANRSTIFLVGSKLSCPDNPIHHGCKQLHRP